MEIKPRRANKRSTKRASMRQPIPARFNSWRFPIHDYFFAAALEKVRPGGLLMFVTSRGTMDKLDSGIRELLSTLLGQETVRSR